ncbi:MAG: DUF861 domain-containing protein [Pirellulales bacterium]|nr:DUF861 domain-containing protein [Pirellulales bacterium]
MIKTDGDTDDTDVEMRHWQSEPPGKLETEARSDCETVGFVLQGRAKLHLEGETVEVEEGDWWVVHEGESAEYEVIEPFSAVETMAPPAEDAPSRRS